MLYLYYVMSGAGYIHEHVHHKRNVRNGKYRLQERLIGTRRKLVGVIHSPTRSSRIPSASAVSYPKGLKSSPLDRRPVSNSQNRCHIRGLEREIKKKSNITSRGRIRSAIVRVFQSRADSGTPKLIKNSHNGPAHPHLIFLIFASLAFSSSALSFFFF